MNNVGQARGDQAQTDTATEHGQQLAVDSETQRGSESDDENAFPRYLRPHLGPVHQGVWLRCFGRLAAHALSSAMTHGPSTPSQRLQHSLFQDRQFWCWLVQCSFRPCLGCGNEAIRFISRIKSHGSSARTTKGMDQHLLRLRTLERSLNPTDVGASSPQPFHRSQNRCYRLEVAATR